MKKRKSIACRGSTQGSAWALALHCSFATFKNHNFGYNLALLNNSMFFLKKKKKKNQPAMSESEPDAQKEENDPNCTSVDTLEQEVSFGFHLNDF